MHDTTLRRRAGAVVVVAAIVAGGSATTACTSRHVAGGLIGGAVVGGAYEYQNKKDLKELEWQRRTGRISEDEYRRRREDIEDRSLIY